MLLGSSKINDELYEPVIEDGKIIGFKKKGDGADAVIPFNKGKGIDYSAPASTVSYSGDNSGKTYNVPLINTNSRSLYLIVVSMGGACGSGAGSATGRYTLSTVEGHEIYSGSCRVPDGGSNSTTFSADLFVKEFITNYNYLKLYLKSASVHNAEWTRSGYCSVSASARYK